MGKSGAHKVKGQIPCVRANDGPMVVLISHQSAPPGHPGLLAQSAGRLEVHGGACGQGVGFHALHCRSTYKASGQYNADEICRNSVPGRAGDRPIEDYVVTR